jgi:hypothetical protein
MNTTALKRRSWGGLRVLLLAGLVFLALLPSIALAEDTSHDDEWTFAAAPYMWFVSLDGDVTVKGQKSDVDLDFSDIWDEMNIGAMIAFEATNSRWGVLADVLYANLGNDTTTNGIKIEPSFDLYVISLGGFYRFGTWDLGEDSAATVSVDGIAGGRYTYLDLELDFKASARPVGIRTGSIPSSVYGRCSISQSTGPWAWKEASAVSAWVPTFPGMPPGWWDIGSTFLARWTPI